MDIIRQPLSCSWKLFAIQNFSFHSGKRAEHIYNELPRQSEDKICANSNIKVYGLLCAVLSMATVKYKSLTRIE
jgi:hypothetical protein